MTYKLNPEIRKILSPITLIFSDGTKQHYLNGATVVDAVFNRKYVVSQFMLWVMLLS